MYLVCERRCVCGCPSPCKVGTIFDIIAYIIFVVHQSSSTTVTIVTRLPKSPTWTTTVIWMPSRLLCEQTRCQRHCSCTPTIATIVRLVSLDRRFMLGFVGTGGGGRALNISTVAKWVLSYFGQLLPPFYRGRIENTGGLRTSRYLVQKQRPYVYGIRHRVCIFSWSFRSLRLGSVCVFFFF